MINNIFLILFNTGFFSLSVFLLRIFKSEVNFINIILNFTLILVAQSYLLYSLFLFEIYNENLLDFYFYIILASNFLFLIGYNNNKEIFKNTLKYLSLRHKYLIFYFFIFLLISLLPASDPDSLDYHLGAPKNWLYLEKIVKNDVWLHFRLSSYGEALNVFSIKYFNLNYLSFLNVIYYIFITTIISSFIKKDNYFLLNFFISTPILIFLIFNQKPHFIGYALIIISIYLMFFSFNKEKSFIRITSIILLSYVTSIKLSFVPTTILIFLLHLIYSKKKYSDATYFIFFSIIFSGTIFYKNYIFYLNPLSPFFESFFTNKYDLINFSNYLKTFGPNFEIGNILLFPIKFFIPFNFSALTTCYGFIFLSLFFLKKTMINKNILLIIITIFLSVIITFQLSNRYYFHFYFMIVLFLTYFNFKNKGFLKLISIFQLGIVSVFLLFYLSLNFKPLISQDYNENFFQKNVYQYEEIKWINNKIPENNFTTDIRSRFFLNNNHITSHFLHYVSEDNFDTEFNKFVKEFDIRYFSFVKTGIDTFFYKKIKNCKKNIKVKKFLKKRRNFLAPKVYIEREIFELDLNNKRCLISKSL